MKQILVLEQFKPQTFRYVLRASVPSARQPFYAAKQSLAVSAYQDPDAPTQASDQASLRSGLITELVGEVSVAGRVLVQIEGDLQAALTAFQADVNASNPWMRYGSFFDGATWTVQTVA